MVEMWYVIPLGLYLSLKLEVENILEDEVSLEESPWPHSRVVEARSALLVGRVLYQSFVVSNLG